jgi:predicted nucleic acid-binding protein
VVEVACAFHRHLREGHLTAAQFRALLKAFHEHLASELWTVIPLSTRLIHRIGSVMNSLPPNAFRRSSDAIQLLSAQDAGEHEVWTNDRHMLAAAPLFGLAGRSV